MKLRWSHTVMYVRDLDAMIDFYRDLLGFEVADRGKVAPVENAPEIVFMSQSETDHHQLAFLPIRQDEGRPNTVDHNAFRCDSVAEVRALKKALEADGRATQIAPVSHGNAWSVYFRDPENNGVEVFCDTPFHVQQPQARPWDPDLSDEELLEWTRQEFGSQPGFGPIDAYYEQRARELDAKS